MVQLLNSIYLGAATPSDYGKAAGVVELLPFDYYLGAAVPSHGKPTVNVLLSGVSPLTLLPLWVRTGLLRIMDSSSLTAIRARAFLP